MLRYVTYALLTAVWLTTAVARADEPSNGYPERFGLIGVITQVDYETRTITLHDLSVTLDSHVVVHTPSTHSENIFMLQPEQHIGCKLTTQPDGHSVVTDIWILPSGGNLLP